MTKNEGRKFWKKEWELIIKDLISRVGYFNLTLQTMRGHWTLLNVCSGVPWCKEGDKRVGAGKERHA